MVGALQGRPAAAALRDDVPAVAADVDEPAQLAVPARVTTTGMCPATEAMNDSGSATSSAGPAYCQADAKIRSRSSSSTASLRVPRGRQRPALLERMGQRRRPPCRFERSPLSLLTDRTVRKYSIGGPMGQDARRGCRDLDQRPCRRDPRGRLPCRRSRRRPRVAHGGGRRAEAGVSKALVHYYFANRRELLRNAFSWADERWAVRARRPSCARRRREQ